MKKITIIGAGNMGRAIADGLLRTRVISAPSLTLSDARSQMTRAYKRIGVVCTTDNAQSVQGSDVVVLAVKPNIIPRVLQDISTAMHQRQLIISIAAGVPMSSIQNGLAVAHPIVRGMSNLCAQVGASMSVWVRNRQVTTRHVRLARTILQAIGSEYEVRREQDIDTCTAISGSGPAYVFYLAEVLAEAASDLGLPSSLAQKLARETVIGSGAVLRESSLSPIQLRRAVTSKGGTTEAALAVMTTSDITLVMKKAARAAYKKVRALGAGQKKAV